MLSELLTVNETNCDARSVDSLGSRLVGTGQQRRGLDVFAGCAACFIHSTQKQGSRVFAGWSASRRSAKSFQYGYEFQRHGMLRGTAIRGNEVPTSDAFRKVRGKQLFRSTRIHSGLKSLQEYARTGRYPGDISPWAAMTATITSLTGHGIWARVMPPLSPVGDDLVYFSMTVSQIPPQHDKRV
jgi:hypothetical protein